MRRKVFLFLLLCIATSAFAQQNNITSIMEVLDTKTGKRTVVKEFNYLIEAPNWTKDGKWLYYNSGGLIYKIDVEGKEAPQVVNTQPISRCNNDHVLSADGKLLAVSSADNSPSGWSSYVYVDRKSVV